MHCKSIFSPSVIAMKAGLLALCGALFTVHAAADLPPGLKSAIEEAQLLPESLPLDKQFMGGSIAIDGGRALVGAEKLSGEGVVYVFEQAGGNNWIQQAILQPPGPRVDDRFGESVSLVGDLALVGAFHDSSIANEAGAAHLFEYDGSGWNHSYTFTASDAAADLRFGTSVSIAPNGRRMAIGSVPRFGGPSDPGAVYVFFDGFGTAYYENAKLTASDGHTANRFGSAVSLENERLLVGASGDDAGGNSSGAAYVFDYDIDTNSWAETQKLKNVVPENNGSMGAAVDLDGDQLIVGEPNRDNQTGAAHIFGYELSLAGWAWELRQTLTAADASTGDFFGESVALDSDTALIGAFSAPSPHTVGSPGAVYAFGESSGTWTETAKITAEDGIGTDRFGGAVALDGEFFVTGNSLDDDGGDDAGAAYAYGLNGGAWSLQEKLRASIGPFEDEYGQSVAVGEVFAVVGAPENDEAAYNAGSAYVFAEDAGQWAMVQQLFAGDAASSDRFGSAVSIDGDRIVIGARYRDEGATQTGAAYVFEVAGGLWSEAHKLIHPSPTNFDHFGTSVEVAGDRIIVGAPGDDAGTGDGGAAHVYEFSGSTWSHQGDLVAPDALSNADCGISASIDGGWAVMGCDGDNENGASSGSAYLFSRNASGSWLFDQKIIGDDTVAGDNFGRSVDLDGDVLAVGAIFDDQVAGNAGAAFVFSFDGNDWTQSARLTAPDGQTSQWFGGSIAVDGDIVLVGAYLQSTGKAYVFQKINTDWEWTDTITPGNGTTGDRFGRSVALFDERAVIGANAADGHGAMSGTAYVFDVDILPTAVDDAVNIDEDEPLLIAVLDNDTDPDGGTIGIGAVSDPANGFASISDDEIYYAPGSNYCNDGSPTDDFTYTLTSGSSATVRVTVNCVDDPPVAVDDQYTVEEDSATSLPVTANDFDHDTSTAMISIVGVTQPANGSASHDGSDVLYTPSGNYCNDGGPTDDFTYELNGGRTATVRVEVTCIDDAAVAVSDQADVREDQSVLIDVIANDTDVDGDTIEIIAFDQPAQGSVQQEGAALRFTPPDDYCNDIVVPETTFGYTVNGGDRASVEVRVICVNDAPDFNYLGDIVASHEQSETIENWAFDIDFGASSENLFQQVEDFQVTVVSDSHSILASVDVTNDGDLLFTTTGNRGVAIIDVQLQDNGGTDSGGVDRSPVKTFSITFDDTLFRDDFEQPSRATVPEILRKRSAGTNGSADPYYDAGTGSARYYGLAYPISQQAPSNAQGRWLDMWLDEVEALIDSN